MQKKRTRPEQLDGAPLQYAPENEQGVVFLFAHVARMLGFISVEKIQPGFPDCIAYRRHSDRDERVRIEFELHSRSFKSHRHPAKGADCIVCWRHNWPDSPRHIEIIELAEYFGHGRRVWLVPIHSPYKEQLARSQRDEWSVGHSARVGDIVLFYKTRPESQIADVFIVAKPVELGKFKAMAEVRRLCSLRSPLHLEIMKEDKVLRTAGFLRFLRGRKEVTVHWSRLLHLICRMNPHLQRKLSKYAH